MSARYKPVGNWREDQTLRGYSPDDEPIAITIEISDVREVSGTIWHDGAHRVKVDTERRPKPRGKTFIGETAWCDAQRYAGDVLTAHRFAR